MADILDECRKAAPFPSFVTPDSRDLLARAAVEIEKLRKEVKLLRAANASLAARNILLMLLFGFVVCGGFMAVFLRS